MASLDFNIAQLRHAYSLLINGHVKDTCQFAVGLIGPVVRDLEAARDGLVQHASNLERYPFESATMAEAGKLAANAIRNVMNNPASAIEARRAETERLGAQHESAVANGETPLYATTPPSSGDAVAFAMMHPSLELCVQFSEDGKHIRKWSRLPFQGGECLYSHPTSGDAVREAQFKLGDFVEKKSGSSWRGTVVGTYATTLTPEGYAVESSTETGSVQIYPAKAHGGVEASEATNV